MLLVNNVLDTLSQSILKDIFFKARLYITFFISINIIAILAVNRKIVVLTINYVLK